MCVLTYDLVHLLIHSITKWKQSWITLPSPHIVQIRCIRIQKVLDPLHHLLESMENGTHIACSWGDMPRNSNIRCYLWIERLKENLLIYRLWRLSSKRINNIQQYPMNLIKFFFMQFFTHSGPQEQEMFVISCCMSYLPQVKYAC